MNPETPSSPQLEFFPLSAIARVMGVDRKTVLARAREQQWPVRDDEHPIRLAPPEQIATLVRVIVHTKPAPGRDVTFAQLAHSDAQRAAVLLRERAVLHFQNLVNAGEERLKAQAATVAAFVHDLPISTRSLRRWASDYRAHGLNGLVPQQRGKSGAKLQQLAPDWANKGKALAIEHGSVAQAARELAMDADSPAEVRLAVGGNATQSYVPGWLRKAITPSRSLKDMAQGPRHARLNGRFTPRDHSEVRAGDYFVADDMTSNVICWMEDNNAQGWRIGQPQILPVMDYKFVWLAVRVIMRPSGAYTGDDCAGVFGDVFQRYGVPRKGVQLEGGIWQGNRMRGVLSGLTDEDRVGGLAALGVKVERSRDPRNKLIENAFHRLQNDMDRFPGYVGREQKTQLPERVKQQLALCKAGKAHPSQFFTHVSELANHIRRKMEESNNTPQEGEVLRGLTPIELWGEQATDLKRLPEESAWIFRARADRQRVGPNGVRVTTGSGRMKITRYYDAPNLVRGHVVFIYWDPECPETPAAILHGETQKFLCIAALNQKVPCFGASREQLEAEAKRKQEVSTLVRTELRAVAPHMLRNALGIAIDPEHSVIGRHVQAERTRTEQREAAEAATQRHMRAVQVDGNDLAAALQRPEEESRIDADELANLFADVNGDPPNRSSEVDEEPTTPF